MNKSELIDAIAAGAGLTKAQSKAALEATLEAIKNAMVDGDKVSLIGFGTFEAKEVAARTGRNPATGKTITIPASKKPAFKAGKELKASVNK